MKLQELFKVRFKLIQFTVSSSLLIEAAIATTAVSAISSIQASGNSLNIATHRLAKDSISARN